MENYTSPQKLMRLYNSNNSLAVMPASGAERDLAIMFLDIRNFTGLMESHPAQDVIQVVHKLFSMFNQIITNFKGTVVEVAGDSLYAVFGLGTTIKEAINQAYQATKMMFETINLFNGIYVTHYDRRPLEVGVALHTGRVVVGRFGLESDDRLSVMGLPVNIASRLQAKTKELNNDLIVSEEAYSLLHDQHSGHEQRTLSLQGISRQQQVRLLGKPYSRAFSPAQKELEFDVDYVMAISG